MEKRVFGKTGMQVSVLGFGGAEIGFEEASPKTVEALLNASLDAGLNVIDTAECYHNSEELIGDAIGKRRSQFYLFSKCGHEGSYDIPAWKPEQIKKSIERSLKNLKTDYLDLIQLHSCSLEILRQGEVIEALLDAKKTGKARFIGYSGDSDAALYAISSGAFDALQTSVNIADQEPIDQILSKAIEKEMGIIAKRPLANAAWRYKTKPDNWYYHEYWDRLQKLQYEFLKSNNNDTVAIALGFTLKTGVHTAIVGTKNKDRWLENAKLLSRGPLPQEIYDSIRKRWHDVAKPAWVGQN